MRETVTVETIAQDIEYVQIDGAQVARDCLGIIDENAKGTDAFRYHIVEGRISREGARAPHGHSWGHLGRHFDASARTRCGSTIKWGIGGTMSLLHTTKLCMDCAATVPNLKLTRKFEIDEQDDRFIIREVEPSNLVSGDYLSKTVSREGAWQAASIQLLPVTFIDRGGNARDLGVVFNPERFERAAYDGYVSAGFCMSDGYYAPIVFDSWVASFRRNPVLDEPEQRSLLSALEVYKASLPVRTD